MEKKKIGVTGLYLGSFYCGSLYGSPNSRIFDLDRNLRQNRQLD